MGSIGAPEIVLLLLVALLLFGREAAAGDRALARHGHARVQGLGDGQHEPTPRRPRSSRSARRTPLPPRPPARTRPSTSGACSAPAAPARPRRGGDARRAPRGAAPAPVRLPRRARRRRSIVAYVFHASAHPRARARAPEGHRHLTTFTIGEPFMTSMWLSVYAGFLIALPVILWQAWAFFLPAFDPAHERMLRVFVVVSRRCSSVVGVAFGYYLALPAAVALPDELRQRPSTNVQIRARDYIGFAAKVLVAMAIVFELPLFVVGLTRIGVLTTQHAAPEPADRLLHRRAASASRFPASTRSRRPSRRSRCSSSTRSRSGLSRAARAPRRARAATAACRDVTELSADWVLPVDGPPIEGGFVRCEDGRIVEVGEGRAERHYRRTPRSCPGFVNAHSHLEYATYAGFGDGDAFGPWIATHMRAQEPARPRATCSRSRAAAPPTRSRSGITTTADYSFSGAAARRSRGSGLRAIVYLEVFAQDRRGRGTSSRAKRARSRSRSSCASASRRTRRTPARSTSTAGASTLGIPVGTHLVGELERERVAGARDRPVRRLARRRPPDREARGPHARARARPGAPLRALRRPRGRRARAARREGRPVAHCPRSNALLGCGIAPLAELRARRRRASGSAPTRPLRRRRSTCSTSCAPRSTSPVRASVAPMP